MIFADGIQLNGNPLTFSESSTSDYSHFQHPFNFSFETDNQSFFNEGENTLSIHVRNWGTVNNPTGLVIDGNVTAVATTPVPEPSILIGLLTVGVLGVTSGLSKKQQKKGQNN
ncbi:MAG: PEP-CTERM sorting domain-containing protein [Okeania sp. SIO3I5]|nr:PEP-CTERM sorting domain-containing protein [Okeania sp. SIO3I5]